MDGRPEAGGRHRLWIELFVLANIGVLAADIALAHRMNAFRAPAEYVPLVFSLAAPLLLLWGLVSLRVGRTEVAWRAIGLGVGWLAVAIGIAGVVLHLGSRFFEERTLASLVYAAPFAAPLAYTGLGLLLIMNRTVDPGAREWPLWTLLLALGGFAGNFVFSLTDHAQNGFFHWTEWIPVCSSAVAVGFLLVPFLIAVGRPYLLACAAVLGGQALVGLVGFYLHFRADLAGPAPDLIDDLVYGAPPMAPLLFPNLVLLAGIGLWVLDRRMSADPASPGWRFSGRSADS